MAKSSFGKGATSRTAHGYFTCCNFQCCSVLVLHSSNTFCYNFTLHNFFLIRIGVHDRSMFPSCSLEGLNNKEQGGSGF